MRPTASRTSSEPSIRCGHSGSQGCVRTMASIGRPNRYFGITWAPRRVESTSRAATPRWLSSQAMSMALLPMPTTSTRLPCRSWGVKASIY